MTDVDRITPQSNHYPRFAASFSVLWAMVVTLQLFVNPWWLVTLRGIAADPVAASGLFLSIASIVCALLRPGSGSLLFGISTYLIHTAVLSPELPNHRVLSAFVAVSALVLCFRGRGSIKNGASSSLEWQRFAQSVRLMLIGTYGFAVFHKLNADFLFGPSSCAIVYGQDTAAYLGLDQGLSAQALAFAPLLTIFVETFVAVLLCLPERYRLPRTVALVVGVVFHSLLVLHPYRGFANFSGIMVFCLLVATRSHPPQSALVSRDSRLLWGTCTLAVAVGQLFGGPPGWIGSNFGIPLLYLFFAYYLFASFARSNVGQLQKSPASVLSWSHAVLLAVFFVNGFAPYLGLKNKSSFDMYSNILLEEGRSNHLLMPPSLDLWGEQARLLTIRRSNIEEISRLSRAGWRFPRSEIDRAVRNSPKDDAYVEVALAEGQFTVSKHELAPDGYDPSWAYRWLVWFRPMISPADLHESGMMRALGVPCAR